MVHPGAALLGATAALNAKCKSIQIGLDLDCMAKDLSRWGKVCADFDFAEKQICKAPWYKALG